MNVPVPSSWPRFDCEKCGETIVVHEDAPFELLKRMHVDGCGLMDALTNADLLATDGPLTPS